MAAARSCSLKIQVSSHREHHPSIGLSEASIHSRSARLYLSISRSCRQLGQRDSTVRFRRISQSMPWSPPHYIRGRRSVDLSHLQDLTTAVVARDRNRRNRERREYNHSRYSPQGMVSCYSPVRRPPRPQNILSLRAPSAMSGNGDCDAALRAYFAHAAAKTGDKETREISRPNSQDLRALAIRWREPCSPRPARTRRAPWHLRCIWTRPSNRTSCVMRRPR